MNYSKRLNPYIRQRMFELVKIGKKTVTEVSKFLGISRKTYYEWNKRDDLNDKPPIPINQKNKTPKELERLVMKIRRKLKWGSKKIHYYLKNLNIINSATGKFLSDSTIRAIFKRYPVRVKINKPKIVRYEKDYAGEMAHIDLKHLSNVKGENPKEKKYLAVLEDDASRIGYSETIPNKKAKTVKDFFKRGYFWFLKTHGVRIESLLSDRGTEFTWHTETGRKFHSFEVMCRFLNVKHKLTRPYRPQTNGKVERFNRTIEEELFSKQVFTSHEHRNKALHKWMKRYNEGRIHMGIKGFTPLQKLQNCRKIDFMKNNSFPSEKFFITK